MRLKKDFITHMSGDEQVMVDAKGRTFSGIVRSNETAAFIVDCLKKETTKEEIVNKMCEKYDAPREVIEKDVEMILEKLRKIDALR